MDFHRLAKRYKLLKTMTLILLTDVDYNNNNNTSESYGIKKYTSLFTKFMIRIFAICTLPISLFIWVHYGRYYEIKSLQLWVNHIRKDKEFFYDHYYIEIKHHIRMYEESYEILLTW